MHDDKSPQTYALQKKFSFGFEIDSEHVKSPVKFQSPGLLQKAFEEWGDGGVIVGKNRQVTPKILSTGQTLSKELRAKMKRSTLGLITTSQLGIETGNSFDKL